MSLLTPSLLLFLLRPECAEGRRVYVTDCDTDMVTKWNWLTLDDGSAYLQIAGTNLCWGAQGSSDALLTQVCDANNELQRWNLNGGTATAGSKFELQPVVDRTLCATQKHWPKFGEIVYLEKCDIPRYDNTNYWTMYK